jgi:hypothetical protein
VDKNLYKEELRKQILDKEIQRQTNRLKEKEQNDTFIKNNNEQYKTQQDKLKEKKNQLRNTMINDNKHLIQIKQQKKEVLIY